MENPIPLSGRRELITKLLVATGGVVLGAFIVSHLRYESNHLGPARSASTCIEKNYPTRTGVNIVLPEECDNPIVDDLLKAPDPNRRIYTARSSTGQNELRSGILSRKEAIKRAGANEEKVKDNRGEYQRNFIGLAILGELVLVAVIAGARSAIFDRKPSLPPWSPPSYE